ncbi:hypothetical protein [Chitinophaga rhizophila]|uniref:DUF4836 family protein n=1 Tax=Chitinophaga rhizophila TaxID=2866212 RepID=A0ABS7GK60_9BACT|nr:hypothetical protein [Chitinophaga rhizophila]MBW8687134.1 hypothetical protein [Chitinophaga rhizophila]
MKRVLQLVALASCTGLTASAQQYAYKIPENAFTVATVRGEQLFKLTSVKNVNASVFGKKLLKELSSVSNQDIKSIDDFGLNLSANIYYYNQITDSIDYNCVLFPIADAAKFNAFMNNGSNPVQARNGMNMSFRSSGKTLFAWNDQLLCIVSGKQQYRFFKDSTTAARYGIELPEDDYPVTVDVPYNDDGAATDDPYATVDTTVAEPETAIMYPDSIPTVVPDDAPPPPKIDNDYYDYQEKDRSYERNNLIKDSLTMKWVMNTAEQLLQKQEGTPSILNNPGFVRASDPAAAATFWLTDMQSIYSSFLPYSMLKYGYMMRGYGSFNSRLYLGNEEMRLTSEIGLDEKKAEIYKRISNQKLNKKFYKYINSDSLVGFMSYAFNTEAYMNELPGLFTGMYGKYDEEMSIAGELLSIALDEKAIAKVVKGDGLFLLSGVSKKQVTYSSYVYDSETFEYKDTVKTKTETLPDFLCMFSSDDPRIIEKMLQYGVKKEKMTFKDGIYSVEETRKMPLNLHILFKDGIVFLGTSYKEIRSIQAGTFKGNLSKEQKALLTKSNYAMFFNPKNLRGVLPSGEPGDTADKLRKLLDGTGNVYVTSTSIKNGYVGFDMIADVPKDKPNALVYFLDLIEEMTQLN